LSRSIIELLKLNFGFIEYDCKRGQVESSRQQFGDEKRGDLQEFDVEASMLTSYEIYAKVGQDTV